MVCWVRVTVRPRRLTRAGDGDGLVILRGEKDNCVVHKRGTISQLQASTGRDIFGNGREASTGAETNGFLVQVIDAIGVAVGPIVRIARFVKASDP